MSDHEYSPRPNDHLVEPFFEGLGHRAPEEERSAPQERRAWLARFFARLRGEAPAPDERGQG